MSDAPERNHDPTPARRARARAEGRVARSPALVSALVLLGGLWCLRSGGARLAIWLTEHTEHQLTHAADRLQIDQTAALDQMRSLAWEIAATAGPLGLGALLLALLANLGQTGALFLPDRIVPRWDRVMPGGEGRSLWSWSQVGGVLRSFGQMLVVLGLGAASLWLRRGQLGLLVGADPVRTATHFGQFVLDTGLHVSYGLVVLGLVDYGARWWRHEQSLRMSTDELREEMRQTEGRPETKNRRRAWRAAQASQAAQSAAGPNATPSKTLSHSAGVASTEVTPIRPMSGVPLVQASLAGGSS